ncbi:MAG: transaldolase [Deltaproteobacteria bacterium]|nr:transaldolase [Deltaproteobacteria bacterium]
MTIYFWYDNLSRDLIKNGTLENLKERGITGVTSNPTIFKNAILNSSSYEEDIKRLKGMSPEEICWELMISDVSLACDLFMPAYQSSNGNTGYVSIELNPLFSNNISKSVEQALYLKGRINKPNLMIKVPATNEGFYVIRELTRKGINVNVTLIFSLDQYLKACESYLLGLEDRLADGNNISSVFSVASFFVSRVDALVNKYIHDGKIETRYTNETSYRNCHKVYHAWRQIFTSKRFKDLKNRTANVQRVLWASTGVKDKSVPEEHYLSKLTFDEVVFTLPEQTLNKALEINWLDNFVPSELTNVEELDAFFRVFNDQGYSFEYLLWELTEKGVQLFAESYNELLKAIHQKTTLM